MFNPLKIDNIGLEPGYVYQLMALFKKAYPFIEWIQETNPRILYRSVNQVDLLCIDLKYLSKLQVSILVKEKKNVEKNIVRDTADTLEKLVKSIKPKQGLFLSWDGSYPAIRAREIRAEAYKQAKRDQVIFNLKESSHIGARKPWDLNNLNPGTDISISIINGVRSLIERSNDCRDLTVEWSCCEKPSLSEIKILQKCVQIKGKKIAALVDPHCSESLLLGLLRRFDENDAVLLSLTRTRDGRLHHSGISISKLARAITWEMKTDMPISLSNRAWIEDFVILQLLMKNKTIGVTPALSRVMKPTEIIEMIMMSYRVAVGKNKRTITFREKINVSTLIALMEELEMDEENSVTDAERISVQTRNPPSTMSPFQCDVWAYDNLYPGKQSKVKYGTDGWIDRYREVKFDRASKHEMLHLSKLWWRCFHWIRGRIIDPNKDTDWELEYPFHRTPLIGTLLDALLEVNTNEWSYRETVKASWSCCLLERTPPGSFDTLPQSITSIIPEPSKHPALGHIYPSDFIEDTDLVSNRRNAVPLLPPTDRKAITSILDACS